MKKETGGDEYVGHCLIFPYPIQGHINPMLQFAKRLAHKRVKITLVLTKYLLKTMNNVTSRSISIQEISDGFDRGGRAEANSLQEYLTRFEHVGRQSLSELLGESGCLIDCVVYDPFLPWILDVTKEFGLSGAAFFTQSCAVDTIYYQVYMRELKVPVPPTELVRIPGLPPLKPDELPSFIHVHGSYPAAFQMVANQFRNVDRADWIFVNTFDELEEEVITWLSKFWRLKAIGPTIPSMYLDKQLQDDAAYNLNIFEPISVACLNFLNKQVPRSVVYVSFGSLAELSADQTKELALALKAVKKPILWVVRASEEAKLPENFMNELEEGLVVSWCPQLEVLSHEALGCFVTHCGWNSTLEALSLGVPMVAMPQWTDQSTNAKFVEDVWKVGIRALADENGLVGQEEIVLRVKHVMDGAEGEMFRANAVQWKEIAGKAVDGGSSDRSIEEFVSSLGIVE